MLARSHRIAPMSGEAARGRHPIQRRSLHPNGADINTCAGMRLARVFSGRNAALLRAIDRLKQDYAAGCPHPETVWSSHPREAGAGDAFPDGGRAAWRDQYASQVAHMLARPHVGKLSSTQAFKSLAFRPTSPHGCTPI